VEVVAVNDLLPLPQLAYRLKHDSVHGRYGGTIEVKDDFMLVDGRPIRVTAIKDPAALGWAKSGADVVLESTGLLDTRQERGASEPKTSDFVLVDALDGLHTPPNPLWKARVGRGESTRRL
jgi:glyceraldehyde 3-phosphate dehydrogenase